MNDKRLIESKLEFLEEMSNRFPTRDDAAT